MFRKTPEPYDRDAPYIPAPILEGRHDFGVVTDRILAIFLVEKNGWRLLAGMSIGLALILVLIFSIAFLLYWGVGIWGINIPVAWGLAIVNFVWWIGIGHAGTFISAILLLLKQEWRTSINRLAETMTLFAVAMAGLFPLLHLGRIWRFYYLFPYPDTLGLWPQWRSPLVWDVIAVLTYGTVSLLFWYVGLIPDLASVRDRATKRWVQRTAGLFALGWRGSARHWQRHQILYVLLAGLATPLVVSVHSIVSLDFSVTVVPGWHSTIFPPYFVAGAIFSGFAMVFTLLLPFRRIYHLEDLITTQHLNNMAKVMLVSGLVVDYGYIMEHFLAWASQNTFEQYMVHNRMFGPYGPIYWVMLFCNIVVTQSLWFYRIRTNPLLLFNISLLINVGMWLERFVIVISSLHRDYLPSAWDMYYPTVWDWATFFGSLGCFVFLFLLILRMIPIISGFEVRELIHKKKKVQELPQKTIEREPIGKEIQEEELYGLLAEFDQSEELIKAARQARSRNYRHVEAYTPFPVEGLGESLKLGYSYIPILVLLGAVIGGASAYFLQWYSATVDYPWNVGGHPFHSWPSFIPITFELSVLGGSLFGFFGMLLLNRLPRLYYPLFTVPGFQRASSDRFFLCIQKTDPLFQRSDIRSFLESLNPLSIREVKK